LNLFVPKALVDEKPEAGVDDFCVIDGAFLLDQLFQGLIKARAGR
jgi:hypothetical protein